jgi:DNA-binding transcriptional LysR family regulator
MLASLIIRYKRSRPNVVVDVHEGIQSSSIGLVRSGHVDFGIGAPTEPHDDLVIEELCKTSYHAVFHKDHRFASRDRLHLADLRGEALVSMPPSSNMRRIMDGAAAKAGFRLDYTITLNTYSAIAQFVRRKMGVTILVSTSLPNDPLLRSLPIDPGEFKGTLALMRLKGRPMSEAALGFQEVIKAHFARLATPEKKPSRARRISGRAR